MTGVDAAKGVIEGLEADRLRKTEPATPTQCQFGPTKVPSLYDGFDECFLFIHLLYKSNTFASFSRQIFVLRLSDVASVNGDSDRRW